MIRAQGIIHRDRKILMVKHRVGDASWWCLPGGGVEMGESPADAVVRELEEECGVKGEVIRQVGYYTEGADHATITFLVDIASQEPKIGIDPELSPDQQILADMQFLALAEIPERDRAYLWAAGLLSISTFIDELSAWGDEISYPA